MISDVCPKCGRYWNQHSCPGDHCIVTLDPNKSGLDILCEVFPELKGKEIVIERKEDDLTLAWGETSPEGASEERTDNARSKKVIHKNLNI